MKSPNIRTAVAAAAVLLCGSTTLAQAADIRSWDQRIDDATKRFVVLPAFNNQAVLDKETQLVWQRYMSNADVSQPHAAHACSNSRTGGRMGWRLPTIAELTSLVDPSVPTGARLPAGHPFRSMSGSPIPEYVILWSSTFDRTSPQDPTLLSSYHYYTLDLGQADVDVTAASISWNFLCVRGADPANAN